MVRIPSFVTAALLISMSSAFGSEIRECPDNIHLTAPASLVAVGAVPQFRWNGEPPRAASRQVVLFPTDDPSKQQIGEAAPFKARFKVGEGSYGWFVIFKDASGRALCRTAIATFNVERSLQLASVSSRWSK